MTRHPYLEDPCWNASDTPLLRNTAAAPSDDRHEHLGKHVFDALHSPPPLTRYDDVRVFAAQSAVPTSCTQLDLIEALNSGADVQKTLLFVAGATGAGKSHMVRWLYGEHVRAAPGDISIHIPRRDTSLVRVVEILAEKLSAHGTALRRLLEDIDTVDVGERGSVELDLVTGLSDYARRVVEESRKFQASFLTDAQKQLRRQAGKSVPEDPTKPAHIDVLTSAEEIDRAEHWEELIRIKGAELALTSDDGPLVRMQSEDPDRRVLDEADLRPLQNLADDDLPLKLHRLRNELADPTIRRWVLNNLITPRAMDFAMQRAGASIKADALQKALQGALETAGDAGVRVVFFFEDWGTVTGVRSGLLEVFTAMEAPHVAVIADTTDELRRIRDNVADRSIGVFELGQAVSDFAMQLTARALNAVRNGGKKLLTEHDRGRIPNKCVDCPFRKQCHSTFGTVDVEGLGTVGTYPLTPELIDRTVSVGTIRSTPRALLIDLIRPVLQEEDEVRNGKFPSGQLVDKVGDPTLQLDAEQQRVVESGSNRDTETIRNILELYRSTRSVESLSPLLADAFDVRGFDSRATACDTCGEQACGCSATQEPTSDQDSELPPEEVKPPITPPDDPPEAPDFPELVREAEAFARGEALSLPNELRQALRSVAEEGIRFGHGIDTRRRLGDLKPTRLGQGLFVLGGSKSDSAVVSVDGERDGEAIRALVWATTSAGSFRDQDLAHARRATALNLAGAWQEALDGHLRNPEERLARALPLLRTLAVLNSLTRGEVVLDDPYDLIDLALDEEPGPMRLPVAERERSQALGLQGLARAELLADIALVQGDEGAPFGVDINLLHDHLSAVASDGASLEDVDLEALRTRDLQDFVKRVRQVVWSEREALIEYRIRLDGLGHPFPPDELPELARLLKSLRATINDKVGRTPPALRQAIEELQEAIEAATDCEPPPELLEAVDVEALGDLEVHAALVKTHGALTRTEPHSLVRSRLVRTVREVETLEGGEDVSVLREAVMRRLKAFNGKFGLSWQLLEPTSDTHGPDAPGPNREGILDKLREAIQLAGSAAALQQTKHLLEEAEANLGEALDHADRAQQYQTHAKALGLQLPRLPRPPQAPRPKDALDHIGSGRFARWARQLSSDTERHRREVFSAWQEAVERLRVPEMTVVAQLGDNDAEAAFEAADGLATELARQVPDDPEEALSKLEYRSQHAWQALARHQGPALELAKRIHDAGGTLTLDTGDAEAAMAAIREGTLAFEVRLRER